jgi:hypothetical protein
MPGRRLTRGCILTIALAGLLSLLIACARGPHEEELAAVAAAENANVNPKAWSDLPSATFIRFQEIRGRGLERAGWDIRILQVGQETWLEGSMRQHGLSVPVKEQFATDRFHDLWLWLRQFPLDSLRVQVDPDAPEQPWRKRLEIDVVLKDDQRLRSQNEWTKEPNGSPALRRIEEKLRLLLVESTDRELRRLAAEFPDSEHVGATEKALRDAKSLLEGEGDSSTETPE